MAEWYEIVSCVCYVEWGLIHLVAMAMVAGNACKKDMSGVYLAVYGGASDKVKKAYVDTSKWPVFSERLMIQHGLNLGIAGCWSLFAAYIAMNVAGFQNAWLFGLIPVLADTAYFVAVDLPALGDIPSQAQTYIVSIGATTLTYSIRVRQHTQDTTFYIQLMVSSGLFFASIAHLVIHKVMGRHEPEGEEMELAGSFDASTNP